MSAKLKQLIEIALFKFLEEISDSDESHLLPDKEGEYHATHGNDPRFWGNRGAGILLIAKDTGRLLLTLRSKYVNEPGTCGIPGGKIDRESESPSSAATREAKEELGYSGSIRLIPAHVFKAGNFKYYNFIGVVLSEFEPSLNWESSSADRFELKNLPNPLHFGVQLLLANSGEKIIEIIQSR